LFLVQGIAAHGTRTTAIQDVQGIMKRRMRKETVVE